MFLETCKPTWNSESRLSIKVFLVVAGQLSQNWLGQHVKNNKNWNDGQWIRRHTEELGGCSTERSEFPLAMARIFLDLSLRPLQGVPCKVRSSSLSNIESSVCFQLLVLSFEMPTSSAIEANKNNPIVTSFASWKVGIWVSAVTLLQKIEMGRLWDRFVQVDEICPMRDDTSDFENQDWILRPEALIFQLHGTRNDSLELVVTSRHKEH